MISSEEFKKKILTMEIVDAQLVRRFDPWVFSLHKAYVMSCDEKVNLFPPLLKPQHNCN
jgi:hypothetical protein